MAFNTGEAIQLNVPGLDLPAISPNQIPFNKGDDGWVGGILASTSNAISSGLQSYYGTKITLAQLQQQRAFETQKFWAAQEAEGDAMKNAANGPTGGGAGSQAWQKPAMIGLGLVVALGALKALKVI